MFALKEFKWVQKLLGLNSIGGFENIALQFVSLIMIYSCYLMLSIYFASNIYVNLYDALAALPLLFGYTLISSTYLHLLIYRERFYSLLGDLESLLSESELLPLVFSSNIDKLLYTKSLNYVIIYIGTQKKENEMIYRRADQENDNLTKYIICGGILICVSPLTPFVLVAYHWFCGKYTLDSWIFLHPVWYWTIDLISPNLVLSISIFDSPIEGRHLNWTLHYAVRRWYCLKHLDLCAAI